MFKFKNIKPADLEKIMAMKEQEHTLNYKNLSGIGGSKTDLVMPHDSYLVGLSSLKSTKQPSPEANGMRVIDASENNFHSIYDLHPIKGLDTEPQMLKDKDYIQKYESAFSKVFNSNIEKKDYEIRSLKVPALHVDALWLHKEASNNEDLYIPILSMGLFENNTVYDEKDFFGVLKRAAKDYNLGDDALGG